MKKIDAIVDQLVSGDDVPNPELIKVVVRVWTGGDIVSPSWIKPTTQSQHLETPKK